MKILNDDSKIYHESTGWNELFQTFWSKCGVIHGDQVGIDASYLESQGWRACKRCSKDAGS